MCVSTRAHTQACALLCIHPDLRTTGVAFAHAAAATGPYNASYVCVRGVV